MGRGNKERGSERSSLVCNPAVPVSTRANLPADLPFQFRYTPWKSLMLTENGVPETGLCTIRPGATSTGADSRVSSSRSLAPPALLHRDEIFMIIPSRPRVGYVGRAPRFDAVRSATFLSPLCPFPPERHGHKLALDPMICCARVVCFGC